MNNALKKITNQAKKLQKDHPRTPWTTLVKEASRQYRTGKIGSAQKKVAGKKVTGNKKVAGLLGKKKSDAVDNEVKRRSENGLTLSAAKHFLKKEYEDQLGRLEVRLFNAKLKRHKKLIRGDIAIVKQSLNKLNKMK